MVDSLNQPEPLSFKGDLIEQTALKKIVPKTPQKSNRNWDHIIKEANGNKPVGNKSPDTFSRIAGSAASLMIPIGLQLLLLGAGTAVGSAVAARVAMSKLGQHLLRGAIAGAVMDVRQGLKEGDDIKQLAKRVGEGK